MNIGYALSSEEHDANRLVEAAVRADSLGFDFALISDHFHPWIDEQGQSPFVWAVIGAIAKTTQRIELGTAVTCPTIRMHPAVIAQAAATAASMMPGRFTLGLGTGENLNEHILGDLWPSVDVRRDMLREAIEVIRELWTGEMTSFEGDFYRVVDARIYTLPHEPPPIAVAAAGEMAATLAAESGDALVATAPKPELVGTYREAGGAGPSYAKVTVCWDADKDRATGNARKWWPNVAIPGELGQELPLPRHFEQAAELVTADQVAQTIVCGPDPEPYVQAVAKFAGAGFDHVALHQVGPDQEGFFRFYERELRSELGSLSDAA